MIFSLLLTTTANNQEKKKEMGNGQCTEVFIFSSGCSNDTTVNDNISSIQTICSNALSSAQTTSFMSVQVANNVTINIGPYGVVACPGGFNIIQAVSGTYTIYNQIEQTQLDQLIQDMQTFISTSISNASTDVQGFLASATNNKTNQQITTELTNAISSSLTLQVINSIITSFNFNNNVTLNVQGHLLSGAACTINQDIFINLAVSNIVQVIQSAVISQQDMVNLQQLLTNSSQTTSKGPLDSYTDTSNASLQWVFVIAVVVVIVALIGLMTYFITASVNCRKKIDKALKQQKDLERKQAMAQTNNVQPTQPLTQASTEPSTTTPTNIPPSSQQPQTQPQTQNRPIPSSQSSLTSSVQ